jgi:integrase
VLRRFVRTRRPNDPLIPNEGRHAPPSVHLGTTKIIDITKEQVQALHNWVKTNSSSNYARTLVIGVLAGIFQVAIDKKMLPEGYVPPCRGIKTVPPRKRKVYMTPMQLRRLYELLVVHPNRPGALVLLLCMFTGARIGNCMAARWEPSSANLRADRG